MKKIYNVALSILLALPFVGCSDFLSVYPLNDIVEENFWTTSDDVESVLMAAYAKLESTDCITRMSFWGEMRSDNLVAGSGSIPEDIQRVLVKDNLLESNTYITWAAFYDVINLANTVIYYADKVQEKDPNYREEAKLAHVAEARALRALSYFYLIRTFKDVPYVTVPSRDDTEDFRLPATSFDEILKSEIKSLEETVPTEGKEWAQKKFSTDEATVGRITRAGIYALLADMTLWNGDYDKCIEYSDRVLRIKNEQFEDLKKKERSKCVVEPINGFPLIKAEIADKPGFVGTVYSKVFGEGYSFESIFELAFVRDQSVKNSFISDYYGSSDRGSAGYLAANNTLYKDADLTATFYNDKDCRYRESFITDASSQVSRIIKYVYTGRNFKMGEVSNSDLDQNKRVDAVSPNWIIYRLSDVILMQAEAMVQKAKAEQADFKTSPLVQSAFTRVNAIYLRAHDYPAVAVTDTVVMGGDIANWDDVEEVIMKERRRELLFEGKRWYDLVRVSRRRGNTDYLVNKVIPKYTENTNAIRIKMKSMDAMYFPISKDELKINPNLQQNPIYREKEDVSKSK